MQGHRLEPITQCAKCKKMTAHLEYTVNYVKRYRCVRSSCNHIEVIEKDLEGC